MSITTYPQLREAVVAGEGIFRVTMGLLKMIKGSGRLGVIVRSHMSGDLISHGLGHLPEELPANQEDEVLLYLKGSPLAEIIEAVLHPTRQGDEILRNMSSSAAQAKLKQIQEIVCA